MLYQLLLVLSIQGQPGYDVIDRNMSLSDCQRAVHRLVPYRARHADVRIQVRYVCHPQKGR